MPPGVRKSEYWKEYACCRCGRKMSARRLQFVCGPDIRECRGRIDCNATIKINAQRAIMKVLPTLPTGDMLMSNKYEDKAARLRKQAENLQAEADRLEAQEALRPVEPLPYEDEDGVVRNPIIRFNKRFTDDDFAQKYEYAAIGIPSDYGRKQRWYTTGPQAQGTFSWTELMDWLMAHNWDTVEQM